MLSPPQSLSGFPAQPTWGRNADGKVKEEKDARSREQGVQSKGSSLGPVSGCCEAFSKVPIIPEESRPLQDNSRQPDAHLFQYSHSGDPSHISREGFNTSSPQLIHSQLSLTGSCPTLSSS